MTKTKKKQAAKTGFTPGPWAAFTPDDREDDAGFCNEDGSPVDGFMFREGVLALRAALAKADGKVTP